MRKWGAVLVALTLTGCATRPYQPVVDTANSNPAPGHTYSQDLAACQQLAQQRDAGGEAAKGAVGGAVVGAALGAILGALSGNAGVGAAAGAGVGGVGAGVSSGVAGVENQHAIVQRCLAGRGWNVVGR